MKSYIDASVKVFESNSNIEVYINLITANYSEVISSSKWLEIMEKMKNLNKGKFIFSKVFKDRPAKVLQWTKNEDNEIVMEIYYSTDATDEKKWMFQHEYIITIADLEAFAPKHSYSMGIMKMLKQEIADKALADTTFLSRE